MYLRFTRLELFFRSAATLALICLFAAIGLQSASANANVVSRIELIPPQSVVADQAIEFLVKAHSDKGSVRLRMLNAPLGASLADHLDGTATFTWTPSTNAPNETAVIFQALDADVLQPVSTQRVLFRKGDSPALLAAMVTVPALVAHGKPVQQKSVAISKKTDVVKGTPAVSNIVAARKKTDVKSGSSLALAILSLLLSVESGFLFLSSYIVFCFMGESLNPINFRGHGWLRTRWKFGRKFGAVVFLVGLLSLITRQYFLLNTQITLIMYLVLTFILITPLTLKYQKSKLRN